ncbi:hypothetical protein [Actinoplanes auranticolor]|uniref:Uncharacterized protein n=1 Tax=Actinoplanes auranticolor TaxID=47988 RepID=A0A919S6P3_9ACTN|nr:hypothetical protein [Actinoplanes auranticolor]GIM65450.1 hypothetical protein Aau02nite_17190 [Actinoplanes auranticolor]
MPAEVLLDQDVFVAYGQIYVESSTARMDGEMDESFRGQSNGLCGAAVPGMLFLMTATHTGDVSFRIELHDREPALDDPWEEAVEVSFVADGGEITLSEWGGSGWHPLPIPGGDYRVRYCASGMDEVEEGSDEHSVDRYLLQMWPAPRAPEHVARQTAAAAEYWHQWARSL